jgi:hypothetical protein
LGGGFVGLLEFPGFGPPLLPEEDPFPPQSGPSAMTPLQASVPRPMSPAAVYQATQGRLDLLMFTPHNFGHERLAWEK